MRELQRLRADHLEATLAFELANRAYFARSVSDRGDPFFECFAENHQAMLDEQASAACAFHVLVEPDGEVVGRFNLYDIAGGTAVVGYRIAEHVAGRGVATAAVGDLCRLAAGRYGLRRLTADTQDANVASRRVLDKAGFTPAGAVEVAGAPGTRYERALASPDPGRTRS